MSSDGDRSNERAKPIIGLAGGVGSGKSLVGRLMAEMGGRVIDADAIARAMLDRNDVKAQLVEWWGEAVLDEVRQVDRKKVAGIVFDDDEARRKLEGLIHPLVAERREALTAEAMPDDVARFVVLDVPLLFETGLDASCDAVVFVAASRSVRLERVRRTRGWDEAELDRREKSQMALDKKLRTSQYVVDNDGGEPECRAQVREIVTTILQR